MVKAKKSGFVKIVRFNKVRYVCLTKKTSKIEQFSTIERNQKFQIEIPYKFENT